jgi:hypothetical protein
MKRGLKVVFVCVLVCCIFSALEEAGHANSL